MKKLVLMVVLLLAPSLKISADELLSPHSMGHILGGIGSFFLGPLPGIGLSILPLLILNYLKSPSSASVFPISDPKYVLVILLEDTKLSTDYVYMYRNKPGYFKGTPFNTAGWTSVEIAGKIIDKIGPILATKY